MAPSVLGVGNGVLFIPNQNSSSTPPGPVPNTGIYGTILGAADDTQSGTQNVYTINASSGFGSTVTQTRTAISLITDSTYNNFTVKIKANTVAPAVTTMEEMQIFAYSDSARTNLVAQTSAWTGSITLTSSYINPWGSVTLPTGTYFIKFVFKLTGITSANQGWEATLS